jgi:SulP family sulfate permease
LTAGTPAAHPFTPKLVSALREGYGPAQLRADAVAGLSVAIVALPLALAIAIASGASPEKGLQTAIVAGLIVAVLGGSRFQIAGPTGAFIPVVYAVSQRYGYDGLVLATLMAGLMLVAAGLARVGTLLRFMPQPLITGFTAGIAVIIFTSQVRDLFGLDLASVPAGFLPTARAVWAAAGTVNPWAAGLAATSVAAIVALRRVAPAVPGFLVVVVAGTVAVALLDVPVTTIGSQFGALPPALPAFAIPALATDRVLELLPSAFTIAFLGGVESLLSAVVADGLSGRRHRSDMELVAQGVANVASGLLGGLPATGAIARTATNIRAGAVSPLAGVCQSLCLLAFLLVAMPVVSWVPLASLAAVLAVVAFNMSEHRQFRELLAAPGGDRLVLLAVFGLTVLVDLTLAIQVGVVLAALLFVRRMAEVVEFQSGTTLFGADEGDGAGDPGAGQRAPLPPGVEVFQLAGPLFFAVAGRLEETYARLYPPPRVFILRMSLVPLIDASGVQALRSLARRCARDGGVLVLSGVRPAVRTVLDGMGLGPDTGTVHFATGYPAALALAAGLATDPSTGPPQGAAAP